MTETTTPYTAADLDLSELRAPEPPVRDAGVLAGVSIVLPCFNEAPNVADAVRAAASAAEAYAADYEVIVVDDGSRDETARIAAAIADSDRRVRLIMHSGNRGYGAAVRSGVRAARMPWILLTDADLQFDLCELSDFVAYAQTADLIVGWRVLRQDPLRRRVNGAAWSWLVRRMFRIGVRDVDCAFKLVRADLAQSLPLLSTGAMISTELIVQALASGARLEEIGVRHRPRVAGDQSGARPLVVLRAFRELASLRRSLQAARRVATP
jgi:hypothetical protein